MGRPEYTSEYNGKSWQSTVQSECLGVDWLRELTIQVDGTTYGEGLGSSKRAAMEAAAEKALLQLTISLWDIFHLIPYKSMHYEMFNIVSSRLKRIAIWFIVLSLQQILQLMSEWYIEPR